MNRPAALLVRHPSGVPSSHSSPLSTERLASRHAVDSSLAFESPSSYTARSSRRSDFSGGARTFAPLTSPSSYSSSSSRSSRRLFRRRTEDSLSSYSSSSVTSSTSSGQLPSHVPNHTLYVMCAWSVTFYQCLLDDRNVVTLVPS